MKEKCLLENKKGSASVIALILLALLTLLGIAVTTTSSIEVQIAGNELRQKLAFFSAESAKGWVVWSPDLYGSNNITAGSPLFFPNNAVPSEVQTLNSNQSFNGSVEYDNSGDPPRGSGYEADTYQAHSYIMTCNGHSSNNTEMQVEIGFYRIGF